MPSPISYSLHFITLINGNNVHIVHMVADKWMVSRDLLVLLKVRKQLIGISEH